jgi:hypothetical protein
MLDPEGFRRRPLRLVHCGTTPEIIAETEERQRRAARRRAADQKYAASAAGRARYARYEASAKGRDRVQRYRRTLGGIFKLEAARVRGRIAAGQARLAAMSAEYPDIAALVDSELYRGGVAR